MTRTFSVKEAAAILGVAPSTVYSWVARKLVPHRRLAGVKFTEDDLDRILEAAKVNATEERQPEQHQPRARLKHIEVV